MYESCSIGINFGDDGAYSEEEARRDAEEGRIWAAMDAPEYAEAVTIDAAGVAWGVWSPRRVPGVEEVPGGHPGG